MTTLARQLIKLSLGSFAAVSLVFAAGCTAPSRATDESSRPEQSGDIADEPEAAFEQELKSKTDAQVQAEIEAAAVGANYMSESDFGFAFVSSKLSATQTSMTQALVREKLGPFVDADPAADKPLATLYASTATFSSWKTRFQTNCAAGDDCVIINKMNAALAKNLRGIKVFYFGRNGARGRVDGVAVSIIIVGRTPAGNLAGVRTIAIWT
jgi:hypothetical protein